MDCGWSREDGLESLRYMMDGLVYDGVEGVLGNVSCCESVLIWIWGYKRIVD